MVERNKLRSGFVYQIKTMKSYRNPRQRRKSRNVRGINYQNPNSNPSKVFLQRFQCKLLLRKALPIHFMIEFLSLKSLETKFREIEFRITEYRFDKNSIIKSISSNYY